jgi:hypothetical protein
MAKKATKGTGNGSAAHKSVTIEVPVAEELKDGYQATRLDVSLAPREVRAMAHVFQGCVGAKIGDGTPGANVMVPSHAVRLILERVADELGL